LCLVGLGGDEWHVSCRHEEDKQQPVTVGHSIRMLAPRGGPDFVLQQVVAGRALVDALPANLLTSEVHL